MSDSPTQDVIRIERTVPVAAERAFSAFTEGMSGWWPPIYTFANEDLAEIFIEPRADGLAIERDKRGNEIVWGTVLVLDRPRRIVFSWQISPAREPIERPEDASEIEVRFEEINPSETSVFFEHRAFDRHGATAADYRAALAAPEGWPMILQRYAESLSSSRQT